ncbi:MAG: hypothetical protein HUJ59_05625 [Bacilli bacterium]|nr:hypothetical protein [Bacilli bacterium]
MNKLCKLAITGLFGLSLLACTKTHTHTLTWTFDDNGHWQVCNECGYVSKEHENHDLDDGVVTLKPTTKTKGIKTYGCKVCDYTKDEELDKVVGKDLWDSFCIDVALGNALINTPIQNIVGLDEYTFVIHYKGEYTESYYDSGLVYLDGIGYCSFIYDDVDSKKWEFSTIQLPVDNKCDISTLFRNVVSLANAKSDSVTVTDTSVTITDLDCCYNFSNMCGDYDAYYATSAVITEITGGYSVLVNVDGEGVYEPHTNTFTVTGFGEQKEAKFSSAVESYNPSVWNGTLSGSNLEIYESITNKELRDALETVAWSDASCIVNNRLGFFMYDYGADQTGAVVDALIKIGFEFYADQSSDSDSFLVYYKKTKSNTANPYTTGQYFVNIVYTPKDIVADGLPKGSYSNGEFKMFISGENYGDPSNLVTDWNAIDFMPGIKVPTLPEATGLGFDCYSFYDDSMPEVNFTMYSCYVDVDIDNLEAVYNYLANYALIIKASNIKGLASDGYEIPELSAFNAEEQFNCYHSYSLTDGDTGTYYNISFSLDYDPELISTEFFRVMFCYMSY